MSSKRILYKFSHLSHFLYNLDSVELWLAQGGFCRACRQPSEKPGGQWPEVRVTSGSEGTRVFLSEAHNACFL